VDKHRTTTIGYYSLVPGGTVFDFNLEWKLELGNQRKSARGLKVELSKYDFRKNEKSISFPNRYSNISQGKKLIKILSKPNSFDFVLLIRTGMHPTKGQTTDRNSQRRRTMKQITVILGSPRSKGNTYQAVRLLEERMCQNDGIEFKYISLGKLNLEYCRGCLLCMKRGESFCPCRDDSLTLRDEMLDADGIVFAAPVYVHTVPALMKNFYDRFAYMCHQPHFRDKAALLLVTTELSGVDETLELMNFAATTWGFHVADCLGIVQSGFREDGPYRVEIKERLLLAADRFHKALTTPRPQASFKELALFNLLKTKINLHREAFPHDYRYWQEQGWLTSSFFNEDEAPSLKSFLASTMVRFRVGRMKKKLGLHGNIIKPPRKAAKSKAGESAAETQA
jgi:multimeric flavodoxin WrbA